MRGSAVNIKINEVFRIPSLELGQPVKIKCQDSNFEMTKIKIFEGNIIFVNERYVTVKGENYKESFTLDQFRRGEARLIC